MVDWKPAFLTSLATTGNVTSSAAAAGITRACAYQARKEDEAFAERWDEASEEASDALEAEARRRAMQGTEKPVFYQGEQCGTIREFSDTLLIVLLKANRPQKFRENMKIESDNTTRVIVEYADTPPHPEESAPGPAEDPE